MQGGVGCGDSSRPGIFISLEHPDVLTFVLEHITGKMTFSAVLNLIPLQTRSKKTINKKKYEIVDFYLIFCNYSLRNCALNLIVRRKMCFKVS